MGVKVSVIIPIYNMQQYLRQCLDSVVGQSLKEIEIIAVNDGSTDKSVDILQEYAMQNSNILVFNQKNQGQARAKNYGIEKAEGKYILFMDPDDYYPNSECIKQLVSVVEKYEYDICGGVMLEDNNGNISITDKHIAESFFQNLEIGMNEYTDIYHHQRFIFKRSFLNKYDIRFPEYRVYEDPPFTLKAICKARRFYALNKPVYVHRTGHKIVRYSEKTSHDVVRGILDVTNICVEYQLDQIYKSILSRITEDYTVPIFRYLYSGNEDMDMIINKIFSLLGKWDEKHQNSVSKRSVEQYKKESIQQYEDLKKLLLNNNNIVLYGAGGIAKMFLDIYRDFLFNVVGMAVTRVGDQIEFEGYCVRDIEEYVNQYNNIIVIIATLPKYQTEIELYLRKMGVQSVYVPSISKLRLADALIR